MVFQKKQKLKYLFFMFVSTSHDYAIRDTKHALNKLTQPLKWTKNKRTFYAWRREIYYETYGCDRIIYHEFLKSLIHLKICKPRVYSISNIYLSLKFTYYFLFRRRFITDLIFNIGTLLTRQITPSDLNMIDNEMLYIMKNHQFVRAIRYIEQKTCSTQQCKICNMCGNFSSASHDKKIAFDSSKIIIIVQDMLYFIIADKTLICPWGVECGNQIIKICNNYRYLRTLATYIHLN